VLLQEFHYGNKTDADARKWVDLAFGEFYFYREPRALPNGVISRYPIVASGTWTDSSVSNRGFAWARIDVPGTRDLWAVSLHFLTSNASARNTEAQELVAFINANVPAGDYLALGGDLNTGSRTEACINTLAGVVYTVGPFPADQANNTNTNASRATPLDWVLADNDLRARQVPLQLGANAFTNGLVFDTRVYRQHRHRHAAHGRLEAVLAAVSLPRQPLPVGHVPFPLPLLKLERAPENELGP
jgi:endonuclease/exonuclease/phosphatase family metal-dependent hydrolase